MGVLGKGVHHGLGGLPLEPNSWGWKGTPGAEGGWVPGPEERGSLPSPILSPFTGGRGGPPPAYAGLLGAQLTTAWSRGSPFILPASSVLSPQVRIIWGALRKCQSQERTSRNSDLICQGWVGNMPRASQPFLKAPQILLMGT